MAKPGELGLTRYHANQDATWDWQKAVREEQADSRRHPTPDDVPVPAQRSSGSDQPHRSQDFNRYFS